MTIKEIETFIYVAQTENLNYAGSILYMTPSALSKMIRRIEGEIGKTLFDREGNRLRLNEEGRIVYEAFRNILNEYDELKDRLSRDC